MNPPEETTLTEEVSTPEMIAATQGGTMIPGETSGLEQKGEERRWGEEETQEIAEGI